MKTLRWLSALLVLTGLGAFAQSSDYAFQQYSTDQGLPSEEVTCILKDKRGFMWFGTLNGLARFDGIRFTVYRRTGKPNQLIGNYIIGLSQDTSGHIWVSTHRGLSRLNPLTEQFTPIALPTQRDQTSDNDYVSRFVPDQQGAGWFSTVDHLNRIDLTTNQLTTYPLPMSGTTMLADPYLDRRGRFWMLQGGRLYRFDPRSRQYRMMLGNSSPTGGNLQVMSLYEDHRGQLWAVSWEKGLFRYDSRHNTFVEEAGSPRYVTSMTEDYRADGTPFFWLGNAMYGHQTGLYTYNPATHQYATFTGDLRDPLSYHGGMVGAFYRDPQTGVLWIGAQQGVYKADPFTHKFGRKLLPAWSAQSTPHVTFITQDQRRPTLYWVGSSDGRLYQWNRPADTFTLVDRGSAHREGKVDELAQDAQGHIWITAGGRLEEYDPILNRWQTRFADKAGQRRFRTLLLDRAGQLWAGGNSDEVLMYNPATQLTTSWRLPIRKGEGQRASVNRLQEDAQGRIWIATSLGVFRLHPGRRPVEKITLHPTSASVQPSDRLQSTFYLDGKGRVWVSGIGFLVQADQNGRIQKTYTLENGLRGDHIFDIREDQTGHLWLATDNLLHQLNLKTGEFRYYGKENGLFSNFVFSTFSVNREGELFFGAVNAFNYFRPEQLRYNKVPPPVAITAVKVGNIAQAFRPGQAIDVPPSENVFSFDFAALSYSQPEKNQYAYQLVGFDDNWIHTQEHSATYMNLEPGTYTFRVKAANNDGVWNEQGTSLTIQIIPPYYKTWWFLSLCVLVVLIVLYSIYQYRERQRQRLESIRNRIATDLHDDMGSTLSSIRIFSDVVQHQIAPVRPEAVPILQRISTSATTLSESMQDIIWTIQTKQDSLQDVVTRMREFGLKIAEARNIEYHMEVSDQFQSPRLDVEQRRNIYLIFKESINNAVKYADCSRIDVSLSVMGRQLRLLISDNGKGFDPATVRQGNGLANLQKRAREIKGKLTLTTAPGAGTQIELLMKLTS
ncbi:hypothetical protein DYU11_17405 [Fibrisoma montanum]|uniref:Histidine kinase domain-containing protein n=1 Tax=Fibrisoma montanum TaxID=2305895 RepID=A0A418M5Q0_9BACT|nr:sensor histidine kinase [Fibrisoma montanum]RIV21203.1 hypothetical protein DYU11_17405 [Fibrisoma montanum]